MWGVGTACCGAATSRSFYEVMNDEMDCLLCVCVSGKSEATCSSYNNISSWKEKKATNSFLWTQVTPNGPHFPFTDVLQLQGLASKKRPVQQNLCRRSSPFEVALEPTIISDHA